MTNLTDLTVTSLTIGGYPYAEPTVQALTGDGTVSITAGIVTLNKATAITVTLTNPTATTDDGKRLSIVSLSAAQHVVNLTGGFGNGGSGENVATFSGAIGDGLHLLAWQGYWYVTGFHQVTIA